MSVQLVRVLFNSRAMRIGKRHIATPPLFDSEADATAGEAYLPRSRRLDTTLLLPLSVNTMLQFSKNATSGVVWLPA